jgi:Mg/Co/Ni transporter MgtE
VSASDWTRAVVVNDQHVVLGVLDEKTLIHGSQDDAPARSVMRMGPTTVRASEDLMPLLGRMHQRDVAAVLVTDPDGRLLGVLVREDADRVISDHPT